MVRDGQSWFGTRSEIEKDRQDPRETRSDSHRAGAGTSRGVAPLPRQQGSNPRRRIIDRCLIPPLGLLLLLVTGATV